MKFDVIYEKVGHVPYIAKDQAEYLYSLIISQEMENVLELGIAHGTATCIIAAALHELGRGQVTAVDLITSKASYSPSAEEQISAAGLDSFVRLIRETNSYTWFLHDEIARRTVADFCEPVYDLCIIDGPKNWTIDGAAFFMADKLLRERAWIIFDDYHWTYAGADRFRDSTDGIRHADLSNSERTTPHVREVFELLVKQHPDYGQFILWNGGEWALAQKAIGSTEKTYSIQNHETTRDVLAKFLNKLLRRFT